MHSGTPRILVVDDNLLNRRLADAYLERMGWQVCECGDGESALAFLRQNQQQSAPIDAVLLDISMPGMSGMEVCQCIRKELGLKELAVIAYTAHAMQEETAEILQYGFDDILIKPITFSGLQAALSAHCKAAAKNKGVQPTLPVIEPPVAKLESRAEPSGPTILIVDDNAINRKLLRAQLESEGWQCSEAENGAEALILLEQHQPSALLLDYTLSDMTGGELLRKWRRREDQLGLKVRVPVVLCSGMPKEQIEAELSGLVCQAFLSKPASREALRETLQPLVAKAHANEHAESWLCTAPQAREHPLWGEFVAIAQADMGKMRRSILSGDLQAVKRAAHSLRGAAGVLQARDVSQKAAEIEAWQSLPAIPDGLATCEQLRQLIETPVMLH